MEGLGVMFECGGLGVMFECGGLGVMFECGSCVWCAIREWKGTLLIGW